LLTAILGLAGYLQGQTTTENYIQSRTYLEPVTTGNNAVKQVNTIQYFDGLGRPKQIVNVKATPTGKDVVTPIEYDAAGRQLKNYLPIPQGGTQNGNIYPAPLNNATAVFGNEKIYSEKLLENSPLDRIKQQIQVGTDWSNKPGKFDYQTNTIEEKVKKFATSTTWVNNVPLSTISNNGIYGDSQLYKNIITDEDENTTIEFKNGKGQLLLVRKMINAVESADTYYIYNEYDQLAFVIPPKASVEADPNTVLNDLCYQYKYDGRNRLVEKKLPGKGWEYMVYNKADQLILTQDTVLKGKGQWLFTKYDQFGRTVYTGITNNPASRASMQTSINANANLYETRTATVGFTLNGLPVYYTKLSTPSSISTLLSVNYYDSYPGYSFNPAFPSTVQGEPVLSETLTTDGRSTQSLPVMSFVKNIEDDSWTKNYTYYDKKGQAIGSHSINYLGGYTHTESKVNFAGLPQQIITRHKRLNSDTERVITETFDYDNQNRLLVHKHQLDSNPVEILAQNKYNELSQLESKKVGGVTISSQLQQIDYKYNIRGWITQINDPANLGNDLFGYKINYNKVEGLEIPNADYSNQKVKPKYNGNIAEVSWKTLTEDNEPLKRYGYVYDSLNRLTAGFYQNDTNPYAKEYNELLTYDVNGNILNMVRTQGLLPGSTTTLMIDNLKYDYIGNKLVKVTDQQQNPSGYPYSSTPGTIGYDNDTGAGNGNMISHPDKGISSIQYNYLNLPRQITQNSKVTQFTYRADGVKVKKLFGDLETDYLDGFQYKSTKPSESSGGGIDVGVIDDPSEVAEIKLRIIPTSEGYYDALLNQYIYNYTDHLGNVRLSYTDTNKDGVIQPRQYFQSQCEDIPWDPLNPPNCISIWKPGEIVEVNNYYPFGLMHNYTATTQNAYQYKYNGKELQESGMYDYGARLYMPDLGKWGVVDPLAEFQQSFSPYAYVYNNPIRLTDPSGMLGSGGGDPEEEPQIPSEKFGTDNNPIQIEEIVLSGVSGTHLRNQSLSYLGISNLDAYHDSQDRFATGIRNSPAALATEKFELNLAFTMGTFLMGGSNLAGSAAWSAFDALLSYQDPKTQNTVAGIQAIALVIQIKHGNLNAAKKVLQEAAQLEGKATYSVYRGVDAMGDIKYVGITKREPAVRWAEHAAAGGEKGTLFFETQAVGLSKAEARTIEQNIINQFGLQKNGGQLLNQVNSIAPSNWKNFSGIISP
jgi:RHS repeat-associated protein